MRRDRERIINILEAPDSLMQSLQGCTRTDFFSSDLIYSASACKLTIVGEAAARISTEMKDRHPQIEWRKVIGLRNFLVHQYFGVDLAMVWEVATADVPPLRDSFAAMLLAEFPG
jgi:uncharacterized protein with HEPN domain